MKKLLSIFMAAAMLFGLASCSGDLHDLEDPNAMAGNWFYYKLDTTAATADSINLIFANTSGAQTSDVKGVAKTGSVYYLWNSSVEKMVPVVSTRADNPTNLTEDTSSLCIYVFTNSSNVQLWAWDDDNVNLVGGDWSNKPSFQTNAVIDVVTHTATLTFKVIGGVEDTIYYINGDPWSWGGNWPFDGWNGGDQEKTEACLALTERFATADSTGTATFAVTVAKVVEEGAAISQDVKVVDYVDATTDPTINFDNGSFTIPALTADKSFVVTIDISDGASYQCSIVAAE